MHKVSAKLLGTTVMGVCLWALGVPGTVYAQYYDDPGLGQKPVATTVATGG